MKKILGLVLGGLTINSPLVYAQTCVQAPSCESLGYTQTESECGTGSKILKCAHDTSKVVCLKNGVTCTELGFIYACTGTDYAGGSGTACDNKYTACTCSSGYTWSGSACIIVQVVNVGDILFSDMTTSADLVSGKTAIGVVFDATNRYAVALTNASSYMTWGPYGTDISGLENCTDDSTVTTTCGTNGKSNTQTIIAQGASSYPAASYCNSYSTAGTSAGDWWLPSDKELYTIYTNKTAINAGLTKAGGSTLSTDDYYWSSTEYNYYYAWYLYMSDGATYRSGTKTNDDYVRAVTAF